MHAERHLCWDGCANVRDLGGLPTSDGRTTRWGAVVRSDSPDGLSAAGRAALEHHGIRTIVDLRSPSEQNGSVLGPATVMHVPVLDFEDAPFWDRWGGATDTVGFYRALLERWPVRFADAVAAVARAEPGGVLVHCRLGRDRTALVAAFVLELVGVPRETIAADYALSADRLRPVYDRLIEAAGNDTERARLRDENVSDEAAMLAVLDGFDLRGYLSAGGLTGTDVAALAARLLSD
jgi:protein-tyrosine phosphatase